MNNARALFLDRDGVINVNHGYVHRQDQFDFVEGIFDVCRTARQLGFLLIVVTNQAGIGRGLFSERDFHELTDWMLAEFSQRQAEISRVYYCPYHPEHGIGEYKREAECRKPNPGMILTAAADFNLDLSSCVLVGDKASDIAAGRRAGVAWNVLYAPVDRPPPDAGTTIITRLHDLGPLLRQESLQAKTPRNSA